MNGRALFYPEKTDLGAMRLAAERFKGTHDFAAVRSVGTNVKTTVRTVYDFEISRSGDMFGFRICANGFLYVCCYILQRFKARLLLPKLPQELNILIK